MLTKFKCDNCGTSFSCDDRETPRCPHCSSLQVTAQPRQSKKKILFWIAGIAAAIIAAVLIRIWIDYPANKDNGPLRFERLTVVQAPTLAADGFSYDFEVKAETNDPECGAPIKYYLVMTGDTVVSYTGRFTGILPSDDEFYSVYAVIDGDESVEPKIQIVDGFAAIEDIPEVEPAVEPEEVEETVSEPSAKEDKKKKNDEEKIAESAKASQSQVQGWVNQLSHGSGPLINSKGNKQVAKTISYSFSNLKDDESRPYMGADIYTKFNLGMWSGLTVTGVDYDDQGRVCGISCRIQHAE